MGYSVGVNVHRDNVSGYPNFDHEVIAMEITGPNNFRYTVADAYVGHNSCFPQSD